MEARVTRALHHGELIVDEAPWHHSMQPTFVSGARSSADCACYAAKMNIVPKLGSAAEAART